MTDGERRELQRLIQWWQDHGIVPRESGLSVRRLIDLGLARDAFIDAIGRVTPAWQDFLSRCVRLTDDDLKREWEQQPRRDALIAEWLRMWNLTPAQWLTGFLQFTIIYVETDWGEPSPATIRTEMIGAPPARTALLAAMPDSSQLLRRWSADEAPPNPIVESLGDFIERMKEAYALRAEALEIDAPTKRRIELHAEWLARFQVASEDVADLLESYPDCDRSTIQKALKSFSAHIDIPLRMARLVFSGVN
jgi:hypothetical protein